MCVCVCARARERERESTVKQERLRFVISKVKAYNNPTLKSALSSFLDNPTNHSLQKTVS